MEISKHEQDFQNHGQDSGRRSTLGVSLGMKEEGGKKGSRT